LTNIDALFDSFFAAESHVRVPRVENHIKQGTAACLPPKPANQKKKNYHYFILQNSDHYKDVVATAKTSSNANLAKFLVAPEVPDGVHVGNLMTLPATFWTELKLEVKPEMATQLPEVNAV